MDVGFTARMEDALDQVADGALDWIRLMRDFAGEFNAALNTAARDMDSVKAGISAGISCPECGKDMLIKFGKAGPFLACSAYPACRCTKNFTRDERGKLKIAERQPEKAAVMGTCPECGKDLLLKKARTGSRFIACSGYPGCKYARPFSTGVRCPRCGEGEIVEKSSKRGKLFYSCARYPQCDYALWDFPVETPCPECGSPLLTRRQFRGGSILCCPNKKCKFKVSEAAAKADDHVSA
jgi:DNA topoisomerase-1